MDIQLQKKNVYQRLLAIMEDLDYIQKGEKTVNGQYRFVSHDQVTSAIHPLLVKHGVMIIPTIEALSQESNRTVVNLAVFVVNADEPTEQLKVNFTGYGVDSSDKGPGKAVSYAYKYAILKLFALETGDDPDNDAKSNYEPVKCLEFDSETLHLNAKDAVKLKQFLEYSAECMGKDVEDVKREALNRMENFWTAFNKWKVKK